MMRTKYTPDVIITRNTKIDTAAARKKVIYLRRDETGRFNVYNRFFDIEQSKIKILNVEGRLLYEIEFKEPVLLEVDEKGNVVQVKEEFRVPQN
ncbi:MAG: hypothetical protein QW728_02325 [Thermoplasmata archaeon]